jgi:DNA mismatch endonuclease (patch repair protein)
VAKTNAAYWAEKVRRNRERDAETDRALGEAGWTVIRVWEHEDPVEAAQRVEVVIRAARASHATASLNARGVEAGELP